MKKRFMVEGMTCSACQAHVDKAVRSIPGVIECNVNLLKNCMDVEYSDTVSDEMIADSVAKAGYRAYTKENTKKKIEKDNSLRSLILSIIFLVLLMYFSMGVMMWHFPTPRVFDMEVSPMGFSLIQFILVLPIIYLNIGYFSRGYKRLLHGPSMDSLIAVGATASILYSIYCMFGIALDPSDSKMLHMSLYFEAAGMILVFVSIGKYLEGLSKKKTMASLESLMKLAPKEALILRDKEELLIPAEDVQKGDHVIVKKGDLIPVDGIILKGSASINQANITGESIPVYKKEKDSVYSSTLVSNGYIELEATGVGKDTTFSQILELVEEASNSKAPISKLADKISGIFVPTIFIISLIVFLANFLFIYFKNPSYAGGAFETAFNYAITVVVIACPCALGLATPVAVMVGTGKGASNGLIIKNAEILERTGHINTIVLDKTGTLTNGRPSVTDVTIDEEALRVIYSMEVMSEHPLAQSIVEYAEKKKCKKVKIEDFSAIDGIGLEAKYNNDVYSIGNDKLVEEENISDLSKEGKTVLYITKNKEYIGLIAVLDTVKEEAKEAIEYLHQMKIRTVMLTGDNRSTAEAIAKTIGIDEVVAECLPKDKANHIESLKETGMVAMVGDGVNDAVALTVADLGVAIGGGSDAASESSDIVLVRNNLMDVVNAIRLSKRVVFTIKLGLFWAFFYNAICVVLASGLFYHLSKGSFIMKPEYGSIAMSISSVSVVLNALSINLFKMKGKRKEEIKMATLVIGVKGMMCKHCKAHVEEACMDVVGVISAVASLENKNVTIECNDTVTVEALKASITDAGYDVE